MQNKHVKGGLFIFIFVSLLISCAKEVEKSKIEQQETKVLHHTEYSNQANTYENFNSPRAINEIAKIENDYFEAYENGISQYYGTQWATSAIHYISTNNTTWFQSFTDSLNERSQVGDSMHCTIYAYEALKAGLGPNLNKELIQKHKGIWGDRELAGWSIGHLLTKNYDWKAYLIIDSTSQEFDHCLKQFKKNKEYPVWRQPNIPLEEFLIIGKDDSTINNLLLQHEFGWGFSMQGIHTWITRFQELKECNWLGAPSRQFQAYEDEKPLFLSTKFKDYHDYKSHVVVFPKKIKTPN